MHFCFELCSNKKLGDLTVASYYVKVIFQGFYLYVMFACTINTWSISLAICNYVMRLANQTTNVVNVRLHSHLQAYVRSYLYNKVAVCISVL